MPPTRGRALVPYILALVFVGASGAARIALLGRSSAAQPAAAAPFLFFYPAIALAALTGGVGPGFTAAAAAALFALFFLPGPPQALNWFWLLTLGPLLIYSLSRLKRLRDRSTVLAQESQRLHFVVDRVSDWILLTDDAGIIQYANQTACARLGVGPDQLTGRCIEDFAVETQRTRLGELLAQCRVDAAPPAEIDFARPDGSPSSVEVSCTAIAASGSRVIHVAGRDITERKAVERKLREARQWEGLGALAGGIAHDFNNLLTAIMGNASLARESLPEDHPVVELLAAIEAAGDRSAELIRMMLATSGYQPRYREKLRLDQVLPGLLGTRELPANIVIRVATEAAEFESDRRSVETLLWSLIANAAESYGDAGGEISVAVRFVDAPPATPGTRPGMLSFEDGEMPVGSSVRITVQDRGSGMTPEVLERAFNPFFTTRFTGRGLGLPAVRGIVRAHGGRLELHTKAGEGTCVEVWLPSARYHVKTAG